jgi:hypothetical protein
VCLSSTLWTLLAAVPALVLGVYACVGVDRGLEPMDRMRDNASNIASMFDARWVIMGHTHQAQLTPVRDCTYVNLGYWGEDDVPEERVKDAPRSPCTYLVIRHQEGDYRAELLSWKAEPTAVPLPSPSDTSERDGRGPTVPHAA